MKSGSWRGLVCLFLGLQLAAPDSVATEGDQDEVLWRLASDGTWAGRLVSLGGDGSQVFTQVESYDGRAWILSAHDSSPPAPILDATIPGPTKAHVVQSSPMGDVSISLERRWTGSTKWATLRRFGSSGVSPEWEWTFPFAVSDTTRLLAAVNSDGQRIVATLRDSATAEQMLAVFEPGLGTPIHYGAFPSTMSLEAIALSGDGSTLCGLTMAQLVVYDLHSWSVPYSKYFTTTPPLGAISTSYDGARIAFGTKGAVQVFDRGDGGAYSVSISHSLPDEAWASWVDISDDGQVMACGALSWNTLYVMAFDAGTGDRLIQHSFQREYGNCISDISLASSGSRLAVGFSGIEGSPIPEVRVFETATGEMVAGIDLPGMANDVDVSPDGTVLAVAYSGSNTDAYHGGGIALYETSPRDIALHGVPHVGTTVTFEQRVPPDGIARVISSPYLNPDPIHYVGVGTLHLQRGPEMTFLPLGSPGEGRVYETDYVIPNDPNLIGTSLYFQGLGLSPRGLSDNYVKMTILP